MDNISKKKKTKPSHAQNGKGRQHMRVSAVGHIVYP